MEIPLGKLAFDAPYSMSQIGTLQCVYYLVLCVGLQVMEWARGVQAEMGQVFVVEAERADFKVLLAVHCASAAATGYFVHYIAERSRKCLDQSATIYFTHFTITTILVSFPTTASFYLLTLLSFFATYTTSRYLCTRREQAAVALDRRRPSSQSPSGSQIL